MTTNPIKLSICPHCASDSLYQLGDGRFKCGECHKKISPAGRRTRLNGEAMDAIVSGFILGGSALAVATESGLNPKTVQFYYGRIRALLAKEREQYLSNSYGSAEISASLFAGSEFAAKWKTALVIGGLVIRNSKIELLFANQEGDDDGLQIMVSEIAGWLVAVDRKALESLQLDRIYCLVGGSDRDRANIFWMNAKRHLAKYFGGFRKHFRLYLREMEFRDNLSTTSEARAHIGALLDPETIIPTGESDE